MPDSVSKILIIGYGNPGRLDDGLGPAMADLIEKEQIAGVTVESNYQLCVEDSDAISRHEVVIFVDADVSGPEPFWFGEVHPKKENSFSSHSISAEALLDMSNSMLDGNARGYMLGIRGYDFNEFKEELSAKAISNLQKAATFLKRALVEKTFRQYVDEFDKQK